MIPLPYFSTPAQLATDYVLALAFLSNWQEAPLLWRYVLGGGGGQGYLISFMLLFFAIHFFEILEILFKISTCLLFLLIFPLFIVLFLDTIEICYLSNHVLSFSTVIITTKKLSACITFFVFLSQLSVVTALVLFVFVFNSCFYFLSFIRI